MSRAGSVRDVRPLMLVGTLLAMGLLALLIRAIPGSGPEPVVLRPAPETTAPRSAPVPPVVAPDAASPEIRAEEQIPPPDPVVAPDEHARQMRREEVVTRFRQAAAMLHAGRHEEAVVALHRVLELAPTLVEAHVNMGYALLGLGRPAEAAAFFEGALDLRPIQANAYYGLGAALGELGERSAAIGAMRGYLHMVEFEGDNATVESDDPKGLFIARARSAIWEWEAQLGRGPWGPTKGIPPGFSEEEVLRDGTGVGVHNMKRGETWDESVARRLAEAEAAAEAVSESGAEAAETASEDKP